MKIDKKFYDALHTADKKRVVEEMRHPKESSQESLELFMMGDEDDFYAILALCMHMYFGGMKDVLPKALGVGIAIGLILGRITKR